MDAVCVVRREGGMFYVLLPDNLSPDELSMIAASVTRCCLHAGGDYGDVMRAMESLEKVDRREIQAPIVR